MFALSRGSPSAFVIGVLWAGMVTSAGCAGVPAKYRTSRLALQKATLGSMKYTYDGGEAARVYGLVTYSPSFRELLSRQPAALETAERAVPFHYLSLGSSIAYGLYGTISLVNAAGTADDDPFTAQDDLNRVITVGVLFLLANIPLALVSRSYLYSAVDQFNAEAGQPGNDPGVETWRGVLAAMPNKLEANPAVGRVRIGWILPAPIGR